MKINTIILISVLFGFTNQLNAQTEFPVLNARWCYSGYGDTGEDLGNSCFIPVELIEVNGKTYSKLSFKPHPYSSYKEILYREENSRFYVIPQDSLNEILVYDFNLEVGDTFQVNWAWNLSESIDLIVQNVDYITTLDSVSRKRISLENGDYYGDWLEGIGSLDWVFLMPDYQGSVSGGYNFICHAKEEELIYPYWANEMDCGLTPIKNIEQKEEVYINTYPNPVINDINVEFNNIEVENLSIFDITGKLIFQKRINRYQNLIKLSCELNSGLYIIKLTGINGEIVSQKFVKH